MERHAGINKNQINICFIACENGFDFPISIGIEHRRQSCMTENRRFKQKRVCSFGGTRTMQIACQSFASFSHSMRRQCILFQIQSDFVVLFSSQFFNTFLGIEKKTLKFVIFILIVANKWYPQTEKTLQEKNDYELKTFTRTRRMHVLATWAEATDPYTSYIMAANEYEWMISWLLPPSLLMPTIFIMNLNNFH